MSTNVNWNGTSYPVPATGEENWGGAAKLDGLIIALATHGFQKSGGTFTLSADADFGASAGLKSVYYKSRGTVSDSGVLRLANAETIGWRNAANSANKLLTVDSSDRLTYAGVVIASSSGVVPVAAGGTNISSYTAGDLIYASGTSTLSKLAIGTASYVLNSSGSAPQWGLLLNASIDAAAAITRSKLASGTAYRILANNSSGVMGENAALTAAHVIYADANGQLAGEATLSKSRGGAGADMSSVTFPSSGTITTNDGTQTLSNKTFSDSVTLPEISTPSTPSSGYGKVYFKSDNFLYQLNDAGTETRVGAGSGGINYISNPDAESVTTGWATYADAAGTSPVDGTGGSPTVTLTRSTSSPLRGTGSFLITKDAANRQGEGVSYAFTIDSADKAKVLNISFDYEIASGTFASGDSSDVRVFIYDVTNSALIPVAPYTIQGGGSLQWKFTGTFQTASSSTSYRLILHCATTSASAYTFKFDNVIVGPQVVNYGAPIGDWNSNLTLTPNSGAFGTISGGSYYTRRVGDSLQVIGSFVCGTVAGGDAKIALPSGHTIDTAKINTTKRSFIGVASRLDDATTATLVSLTQPMCFIDNSDTSNFYLGISFNSGSYAVGAGNSLFANSDTVTFNVTIPIAGWSSTVLMSNDTDTRVVALIAKGDPASASSGNPIIFPTTSQDTHGSYNATTGRYTAPVSGFYKIGGVVGPASSACSVKVYVDAVDTIHAGSLGASGDYTAISAIVKVTAGQIIDVRPNATLDSDAGSVITIERLSGPSAIAASETIAASYTTNAGQTIATGTATIIDFEDRQHDTHGSVTTGASWKFTAQSSGIYAVKASMLFAADADWTATETLYLDLFKDGALYARLDFRTVEVSATSIHGLSGGADVNLVAGSYIDVRVTQSSGGNVSLDSTSGYNTISIHRI